MTRDEKLAYQHLWETVIPEGMTLNARNMNHLLSFATGEQKQRAYLRALIKPPVLLPEEF